MIPICPTCHVSLLLVQYKAIEIDTCPQCQGIWLDAGELESLTGDRSDNDPFLEFQETGTGVRKRKCLCPRCDGLLEEVVFGPSKGVLKIDRCPRGHGLWFDAQELQHLLSFYKGRGEDGATMEHLHEIFGNQTNH